jgi:hypothetical protein
MGISEVRSPWSSTRRSDSEPEEPRRDRVSRHSEEPQMPEPEPRSSDEEGEQQFSPLPPLAEEPRSDSASNPAGSGADLGRPDPAHLRQFWQQMGIMPDVPGGSLGVTGPDE